MLAKKDALPLGTDPQQDVHRVLGCCLMPEYDNRGMSDEQADK
jgi:hypothetical protein